MGNLTYPPAPVTVAGDNITIDRFLKDPTAISKYVATLADAGLIADSLLTNTFTTESGSFVVEDPVETGTTTDPEVVAPGAEYPLTNVKSGDAHTVETLKRGFDAKITDESISRRKFDPVAEAFNALVYQLATVIDEAALSAVGSAVSDSKEAIGAWGTDGSNFLRDLMLARAHGRNHKAGINYDKVVVNSETAAMLASDEKFAQLLSREDHNAPVYTGVLGNLAGFTILESEFMPAGAGNALVIDSTRLGGGYSKAQGSKIEAKSWRDEDRDAYRVRIRRVTVPIVVDPRAGFVIEGVQA